MEKIGDTTLTILGASLAALVGFGATYAIVSRKTAALNPAHHGGYVWELSYEQWGDPHEGYDESEDVPEPNDYGTVHSFGDSRPSASLDQLLAELPSDHLWEEWSGSFDDSWLVSEQEHDDKTGTATIWSLRIQHADETPLTNAEQEVVDKAMFDKSEPSKNPKHHRYTIEYKLYQGKPGWQNWTTTYTKRDLEFALKMMRKSAAAEYKRDLELYGGRNEALGEIAKGRAEVRVLNEDRIEIFRSDEVPVGK